ncbi:TetR/AcrR family transcriptional regulator [Dongia sedimenti]|uniref:TetR/AcrR family transcriptional regulator n=1 Tax=Dongia sedimenti TaxID=3064282 RepID=A0ABU0YIE8_9PROT|nr:TetR/AcrR family transcriptional regulator [Rhodospirillaceae bacterium R-7]
MSSALAPEALTTGPGPSAGRRPEKTEAILDAAGHLFREHGYGAVSMDQIAREAGVSKATVYAHFESKDRLFAAMIHGACRAYAEGLMPAATEMEDVRAALTRICREIERFLLAPKTLGIYRVIMAEGPRFPELVQSFIEAGPLPFRKMLAEFFEAANRRGALKVPNPQLAAHQLVWLVRGPLYLERMLNLKQPLWDEQSVDEVVAGAVDMFMKGYAPDARD